MTAIKETGIMETRSRFAWPRFAWARFGWEHCDWEGITIAAFLAGYVILDGVVFAKIASFGAFFIH